MTVNKRDNQTPSFSALPELMNSASVVESETHCCFLVFQIIAAHPNLTKIPDVHFLVSISPALSASLKMSKSPRVQYNKPKDLVPFRYRNILLANNQCA